MRSALLFALLLAAACKRQGPDAHARQGSGTPTLGAGSAELTKDQDAPFNTSAAVLTGADTKSGDAGQQDASAPPDQDALAAAALGTHRAELCPSTVHGATTTAEIRGADVVLTITAPDAAGVAAIRERTAKALADKSAGSGSGVDENDLCPVRVPAGGTATMADDPKGVVVSLRPKDSLDQLKIDTDGRIDKATAWMRANTSR